MWKPGFVREKKLSRFLRPPLANLDGLSPRDLGRERSRRRKEGGLPSAPKEVGRRLAKAGGGETLWPEAFAPFWEETTIQGAYTNVGVTQTKGHQTEGLHSVLSLVWVHLTGYCIEQWAYNGVPRVACSSSPHPRPGRPMSECQDLFLPIRTVSFSRSFHLLVWKPGARDYLRSGTVTAKAMCREHWPPASKPLPVTL